MERGVDLFFLLLLSSAHFSFHVFIYISFGTSPRPLPASTHIIVSRWLYASFLHIRVRLMGYSLNWILFCNCNFFFRAARARASIAFSFLGKIMDAYIDLGAGIIYRMNYRVLYDKTKRSVCVCVFFFVASIIYRLYRREYIHVCGRRKWNWRLAIKKNRLIFVADIAALKIFIASFISIN